MYDLAWKRVQTQKRCVDVYGKSWLLLCLPTCCAELLGLPLLQFRFWLPLFILCAYSRFLSWLTAIRLWALREDFSQVPLQNVSLLTSSFSWWQALDLHLHSFLSTWYSIIFKDYSFLELYTVAIYFNLISCNSTVVIIRHVGLGCAKLYLFEVLTPEM